MSYILLIWLLAPLWWPISLIRKLLTPEPQRIAMFEIAGIGDIVCSAHLLDQLRLNYPRAQIDLVIDPIGSSLTPALPMIDKVIVFPYARQRGILGRLRLIWLCLGYDTGVCLVPGAAQLTAFCLAALARRLSILPAPTNNSYRCLAPLMTATVVHQRDQYFPQSQATLLQTLCSQPIDSTKQLRVGGVSQPVPGLIPEAHRIGLLIGSGRALKRLSPDWLAALVSALLNKINQRPTQVFLVGGPADQQLASEILNSIPAEQQHAVIDLTGRYPLADLTAALKQLSLLIGVDSGVTHMADAIGIPLICLAGPVELREVYQPADRRVLLSSSLPCHPCSWVFETPSNCRLGHRNCLQQLNVDDVVRQVMRLLERTYG